jgi:hypothetical protein
MNDYEQLVIPFDENQEVSQANNQSWLSNHKNNLAYLALATVNFRFVNESLTSSDFEDINIISLVVGSYFLTRAITD